MIIGNQMIRIFLRSFDHRLLDKAAESVVYTVRKTGANVGGPIPLPRKIERFTVNRSPHVNKKSREQFEIRDQKRLVIINSPTPSTIDSLRSIDLPVGVGVEIKLEGIKS